jgi:hypothetical protein
MTPNLPELTPVDHLAKTVIHHLASTLVRGRTDPAAYKCIREAFNKCLHERVLQKVKDKCGNFNLIAETKVAPDDDEDRKNKREAVARPLAKALGPMLKGSFFKQKTPSIKFKLPQTKLQTKKPKRTQMRKMRTQPDPINSKGNTNGNS